MEFYLGSKKVKLNVKFSKPVIAAIALIVIGTLWVKWPRPKVWFVTINKTNQNLHDFTCSYEGGQFSYQIFTDGFTFGQWVRVKKENSPLVQYRDNRGNNVKLTVPIVLKRGDAGRVIVEFMHDGRVQVTDDRDGYAPSTYTGASIVTSPSDKTPSPVVITPATKTSDSYKPSEKPTYGKNKIELIEFYAGTTAHNLYASYQLHFGKSFVITDDLIPPALCEIWYARDDIQRNPLTKIPCLTVHGKQAGKLKHGINSANNMILGANLPPGQYEVMMRVMAYLSQTRVVVLKSPILSVELEP